MDLTALKITFKSSLKYKTFLCNHCLLASEIALIQKKSALKSSVDPLEVICGRRLRGGEGWLLVSSKTRMIL